MAIMTSLMRTCRWWCFGPALGAALVAGVAADRASALTPQRIAAVVNDQVISMQDLNERLQLVMVTSGIAEGEEARTQLAPQVLRGLIEETLQLQEAERLNIPVEEQELARAFEDIARRNDLTPDELRRYLEGNDIGVETLNRQLRAQIAWVKVVNRQIRPQVNVTIDQLEMAVQEAQANRGEPEMRLSEIVLPVDNPQQEQSVAEDARRIVETVSDGASFASLARQVSVAASAEQGGDLGWVPASALPPELLDALEPLQPGEVSEPIRSPIGFHIFWLRDRRVTQARIDEAAGEVEVELTQILFPVDDGANGTALNRLRTEAAALRDDLDSCEAMVETADELAAPASGMLGWLEVGDLPPELAQTVLALPPGEVSPPLEGPGGIHLLMVCDRREPEGLLPQRDEIAERLERERIERLARRYLRDLRKQAFVEVRL